MFFCGKLKLRKQSKTQNEMAYAREDEAKIIPSAVQVRLWVDQRKTTFGPYDMYSSLSKRKTTQNNNFCVLQSNCFQSLIIQQEIK